MYHYLLTAAVCISVASCATVSGGSYVTTLDNVAVPTLSSDVADHVASAFLPASTTLILQLTNKQASTSFATSLVENLKAKGFGVAVIGNLTPPADIPETGIPLGFTVTEFNDTHTGFAVQLNYAGKTAARYYTEFADGSVLPAGACTIVEVPNVG